MKTQSPMSLNFKRTIKYISLVIATLAIILLSYEARDFIVLKQATKRNLTDLAALKDPIKSEAAIDAMVAQGAASVDQLIAALRDRNSFQNAAWALARIKDKRAVQPLINILADDKIDLDYKMPAIYALGELCDQQAVNALITLLADKRLNVCSSAAIALGKIKDPRAVDQLITALKEKEWPVRRDVIWALGKIKDVRSTDYIINSLNDQNINVQRSAVRTLGDMQESKAVQPLFEYFKKRQLATDDEVSASLFETVTALGKIGTPALDTLSLLTEQSDHDFNKYILSVIDKTRK